MKHILHSILEQVRSGSPAVIATVVRSAGSTPQKPGSSALFSQQGLLAGTVGGGLTENEIQHIAESVLISGDSDHFYFDLDSKQGEPGAICGGATEVLVDANPALHLPALEEMEKALSGHRDGFLLTVVSRKPDRGKSISRYWIGGNSLETLSPALEASLRELIGNHLKQARRFGFTEVNLKTVSLPQIEMAFLEHIYPRPQLVIVGGGHIGKALAHIGSLLSFEVSVIDDRQEFANKDHIPDADHLVVDKTGSALQEMEIGPDTYIVIVTRGHEHDGEALKACIKSDAAYIGMIGSKNKVGIIKKQFLDEGWASTDQWSAIYAPIGLDIGSKTVQEIAISIAAQLVEVRNHKNKYHAD